MLDNIHEYIQDELKQSSRTDSVLADKYYDQSFLDIYSTRYKLFVAVLATLAAITILVPLMVGVPE